MHIDPKDVRNPAPFSRCVFCNKRFGEEYVIDPCNGFCRGEAFVLDDETLVVKL